MLSGGTVTMASVSGLCTGKNGPLETNVPCPQANVQSCALRALLLWDSFLLPGPVFPLLH